jgi:two-component system, NtrC family, response regulator HydG
MKRVLIVDDDRELAKSLAYFVESNGHEVTVASNGQEAVDCHRTTQYDVTVMDVRMPVMNGVDSFFEIRKLRSNANVILMTGLLEPITEKALRSGAVGLLQKPFAYSVLLGTLEALIAQAV